MEIKSNPKCFWKYVKSKSKTKIGVQGLKNEKGDMIEDPIGKANLLNEYFSSVFTKENNDNTPTVLPTKVRSDFQFKSITEEEILKKLKKFKINKSPGPDNCHPRILKEVSESLVAPLCIIFNQSLDLAQVPKEWKIANVTPIFKKGERCQPKNYRPVSLTSILCKLLESCLRDQILYYMKSHNLFDDNQHGFLPRRSCTTQLLLIMEHWTKLLDEGNSIDTIYLDFSKAFDSVPHNRLLIKLRKLGMCENVINWFSSFLSDRYQRVCIDGVQSKWTEVHSGVPQGSVIGPILFLIYINDLPETVCNFIKIFADDTKLYSKANSNSEKLLLQNDIDAANTWANMWQLPFNKSKCKAMHVGKNNQGGVYNIEIEGGIRNNLCNVNEEKDLGITFDNNLTFRNHIHTIINKGYMMLGIIKRSFEHLDKKTFLLLYKAQVRSQLEYANTIWRPFKRTDIDNIERVQRRATKCIKNISHLPYEERLKYLDLPTLEYRRARGDMLQTYKIMHNIDNLNPSEIFTLDDNSRTRGHPFKIKKQSFNLDVRKYSFSNRIVNDWNSLPTEVVLAPSLNSFKNRLDKYWKDRSFIY